MKILDETIPESYIRAQNRNLKYLLILLVVISIVDMTYQYFSGNHLRAFGLSVPFTVIEAWLIYRITKNPLDSTNVVILQLFFLLVCPLIAYTTKDLQLTLIILFSIPIIAIVSHYTLQWKIVLSILPIPLSMICKWVVGQPMYDTVILAITISIVLLFLNYFYNDFKKTHIANTLLIKELGEKVEESLIPSS